MFQHEKPESLLQFYQRFTGPDFATGYSTWFVPESGDLTTAFEFIPQVVFLLNSKDVPRPPEANAGVPKRPRARVAVAIVLTIVVMVLYLLVLFIVAPRRALTNESHSFQNPYGILKKVSKAAGRLSLKRVFPQRRTTRARRRAPSNSVRREGTSPSNKAHTRHAAGPPHAFSLTAFSKQDR